jgi:hypothetical protein
MNEGVSLHIAINTTLAEYLADQRIKLMKDCEYRAEAAAAAGDRERQSEASTECERHRAVYMTLKTMIPWEGDRLSEIERLRAGINEIVNCQSALTRASIREAMAELLKGKTTSLPDQSPLVAQNFNARAENERLRAALRRIAHAPHGKVYCADGHEEAVLIARAALEGGKTDD